MEVLAKLFGSGDKVKVMKLFILNPDLMIEVKEIARRCKVNPASVRHELNELRSIGFLVPKKLEKKEKVKEKSKPKSPVIVSGWQLNPTFPYLGHLKGLLKTELVTRKLELTDRFNTVGKVKLLLIAGIFIQDNDSRADLVLVGDRLKRAVIERAIKSIEAEIGRELNYSIFETNDFLYRLGAYDKFIRDLLDYPHEKIINKLGI
ncbi:MAG: hypothetical protein AAB415_01765 [Patescibacteria group bacterium]